MKFEGGNEIFNTIGLIKIFYFIFKINLNRNKQGVLMMKNN